MEIEAWFKIVGSQSHWAKVSLEGLQYIDDLKGAIKKRMEPGLNSYDPASFTIKTTYNDERPSKCNRARP